jgi:hypothetical protein
MIADDVLLDHGRADDRAISDDGGPTDPRLRKVWDELMRPSHRRSSGFRYPTTFDTGDGASAADRQKAAAYFLIRMAFGRPWPVMTKAERDATVTDLRDMATTLRTKVDSLERNGLIPSWNMADWSSVPSMIVAAMDAEAAADDVERMVLLTDRDRGNHSERGMVVWLASWTQFLFGETLPAVVGNLAELVTGKRISESRIRRWANKNKNISDKPKTGRRRRSRKRQAKSSGFDGVEQ